MGEKLTEARAQLSSAQWGYLRRAFEIDPERIVVDQICASHWAADRLIELGLWERAFQEKSSKSWMRWRYRFIAAGRALLAESAHAK